RLEAGLASAKFFRIVRRGLARDVEEGLALADTGGACRRTLALGRDAVDGDFGLVHRDRPGDAQLGAELVHQVQVRVEAEVARVADHPVGAGLADFGDQFVAAAVLRPVLGVVPASPEQQVAVLEGIEATALLAPAAGAVGADVPGGYAQIALVLGGGVVPVPGGDVVAVGAVLRGQFPVAAEDVAGRAAQHFDAI